MRKKLRNRVESLKLKAQSLKLKEEDVLGSFRFPLSTFSLIILYVILSSCSKDNSSEVVDTFTCPMHPTVVSDKPGVCPVCAMDLVRKARPGEEVKITEDLARLIKSTNEVVVSDINTVKGEYKSMPVSLPLQGVVTYDTRNIYNLSSRIGGRLEKVYVKYMFQPVRKGQKIAEVYSAELVNAQREFLYLLKNDSSNKALLDAAKTRLALMGVSESQLNELISKNQVTYTFTLYSPYSGYVISNNQTAPAVAGNSVAGAAMTTGGMGLGAAATNSTPAQSASGTPVSVEELTRAGSYVNAGQILFRIVNTEKLWIEFNVPVNQAPQIKTGDQLVWINDNQSQRLKVDFIEPFFSEGEDFVKVRCYVKNEKLSIGQLVEATLNIQSGESLWLPVTAVLDLGNDKVVFVKERGLLKPRKVKTGGQASDWIEIQSGLTSGDEVAAYAQYLIDSENFVKTAN